MIWLFLLAYLAAGFATGRKVARWAYEDMHDVAYAVIAGLFAALIWPLVVLAYALVHAWLPMERK